MTDPATRHPLWIADQVRNDVTMRGIVFTLCSQCQALGQALVLSHQGRGGLWRLGCLVVSPAPPLWIADQVRNDGSGAVMLASRQYPQGGEGETSPKQPLTVIAGLIRNPEGRCVASIRRLPISSRFYLYRRAWYPGPHASHLDWRARYPGPHASHLDWRATFSHRFAVR